MEQRWKIRRAGVADAPSVAEVHIRSWRDAYTGILTSEEIESRSLELRIEGWTVNLNDEAVVVSLLEERGRPVGFVSCGPCGDGDATPGLGEIKALYLVKDAWRKGYGRRLLRIAMGCLRDRGFDEATLWVLRDNDAARSFYETEGWRLDGGEKDCFGGLSAPALRMRRAVKTAG
jgi:GNAT superfamily N-acetyltransferase